MNPIPSTPDFFWGHIPSWAWPIIVIGIAGFFIYQAVKASEAVAAHFGSVGLKIRNRATRWKRMESTLERVSDKLECATTYLVIDADYHHHADIIIADNCPGVFKLLPKRIPYTDFVRMWEEGWRP